MKITSQEYNVNESLSPEKISSTQEARRRMLTALEKDKIDLLRALAKNL